MPAFTTDERLIDPVRRAAYPLTGGKSDYDPMLNLIGEARFVLIGEASHGTHVSNLIKGKDPLVSVLREPRLERAIGVIYRPETERQSHYFFARLN
jgi:erythromycin esterase-like protein